MKNLLLLFVLVSFFNVTHAQEFSIRGVIKNPKGDVIKVLITKDYLSYKDSVIAEGKLNKDGSFELKGKLDAPRECRIGHGEEITYAYLSPADELYLTLDTKKFDESVYYKGKGAEINNFIAQAYLHFEKADGEKYKLLYNMQKDTSSVARQKYWNFIDNLYKEKMDYYTTYKDYPFAKNLIYEYVMDGAMIFGFKYNEAALNYMNQKLTPAQIHNESKLSDERYIRFIGNYYDKKRWVLHDKNKALYKENKDAFTKDSWEMLNAVPSDKIQSYLKARLIYDYLDGGTEGVQKTKSYFREYTRNNPGNDYSKLLAEKYKSSTSFAPGNMAPDFSYVGIDGNMHSLQDYKGKYILLDVWATWCGPCRGEIPHMQKIHNDYKDKNFTIVSVSMDGSKENWEKFLKKADSPWVQLWCEGGWESEICKKYNVRGIPRFVLIDPEGKIMDVDSYRPSINLREKLEEIFKN